MGLNKLQRGFTVIELLIAIAVLGILVVVAIPQFVEYTHKGEDNAAQADARTFLSSAVGAESLGALEEKKDKDKEKEKPKSDKPAEKTADKPADKPAEKSEEKPAEKPAEKSEKTDTKAKSEGGKS